MFNSSGVGGPGWLLQFLGRILYGENTFLRSDCKKGGLGPAYASLLQSSSKLWLLGTKFTSVKL